MSAVTPPPPVLAASPSPGQALGRLRQARTLLSNRLANLALLYGTPLASADLAPDQAPRERLFLALMAGLVHLGHELAAELGRPIARRNADLATLFLALTDLVDDAAKLAQVEFPSAREIDRAFAKAAPRLATMIEALTADPVYGVPLHNGITYVGAWTFGRLALAFFASGRLEPEVARRRLADFNRETASLIAALVELVWASGPPSREVRRALSKQIGGLHLPRSATRPLSAALEAPVGPAALARRVQGREHRRFVLTQAILASLVDGRRSRAERAFLGELARAFGFEPAEVAALELELAAFYAEHREFVDTFTAGEAGMVLADELVDDMARRVEKNLSAVVQELKQTGELAELLTKAARGGTLSLDERQRVRRDLIDVAKAVPSLALLAAPGGMLLLAALTKVLPFSILPSAWDEPAVGKRQAE